jgi:hypothetical protein
VNAHESASHEQAAELLPWLLNESLDGDEKEMILQHTRTCVICRRELESLRQLRDSVVDASSAGYTPAPDMRNINARIDALIDRQNRGQLLISRIREMFGNRWRIAFAAQSVLLIVLAGILLWPGSEKSEFMTLTEPDELPDGTYIRVVFSPEITTSELSGVLARFDLSVIDGPSVRGVYTVGVPGSPSPEQRERLLLDLQGDPKVLFAQPVLRRTNK